MEQEKVALVAFKVKFDAEMVEIGLLKRDETKARSSASSRRAGEPAKRRSGVRTGKLIFTAEGQGQGQEGQEGEDR